MGSIIVYCKKYAVHAMKTTFGVEFSTKRGLNFNIEIHK